MSAAIGSVSNMVAAHFRTNASKATTSASEEGQESVAAKIKEFQSGGDDRGDVSSAASQSQSSGAVGGLLNVVA